MVPRARRHGSLASAGVRALRRRPPRRPHVRSACARRGHWRWAELNAETFARARAEGRIVLIDGSAEWCHWCHVMDATTYRDPEVRKLLGGALPPGEGRHRREARLRGALPRLGMAGDGAHDGGRRGDRQVQGLHGAREVPRHPPRRGRRAGARAGRLARRRPRCSRAR